MPYAFWVGKTVSQAFITIGGVRMDRLQSKMGIILSLITTVTYNLSLVSSSDPRLKIPPNAALIVTCGSTLFDLSIYYLWHQCRILPRQE